MHPQHLFYALAFMQQRKAEERTRLSRIAEQARTAPRTSASAPQKRQGGLTRRLHPVGEAA